MLISLKFFVLVAFLGCMVKGKEGDELKAVVVLFRHGDRSPLSSWPNDVYYGNASLWPDGYGQLNNLGKERHYELGKWFRQRYDDLLPQRYNPNDIYVKSTDVDRTLMSAAHNLAGLYPPEGDQVWNSNIPWQAIPIHTTPRNQDPILTGEVSCPKFDKLYNEYMNSEEFQEFNRNLAPVFQNLSEFTGYSLDELSVSSFSGLFSTITIYKGFNYPLPQWTDEYWDLIKYWGAKNFQFSTGTPDLARLRTGPFFDYLFNFFDSVRNSTVSTKFLMLSAHDSTIGERLNALGVYPDASPEFASTVIWEIKSNLNEYYVNMYFKNSTNFDKILLPGCEFDCGLEEFADIVKPVRLTVQDWTTECYE